MGLSVTGGEGLFFDAGINLPQFDKDADHIEKRIADIVKYSADAQGQFAKALKGIDDDISKTLASQRQAQSRMMNEMFDYAKITQSTSPAKLNAETEEQIKLLVSLTQQYRELSDAIKNLKAPDGLDNTANEAYKNSLSALLLQEKDLMQGIEQVTAKLSQNQIVMKSANDSVIAGTSLLHGLIEQYDKLSAAQKELQPLKTGVVISQAERDLLKQQLDAAEYYKQQGGQLNIPKPEAPQASLEDILGKGYSATIKEAQATFNALDEDSKSFITTLTNLRVAAAGTRDAINELNKQNDAGQVSATDYAKGLTILNTQQKILEENIKNLINAQKSYDAINNTLEGSRDKAIAQLKDYQAQLSAMSESERNDPSIGGALEQQVKDLQKQIDRLDPKKLKEVVSQTKTAFTELRELKNQLATTDQNDPGYSAMLERATELQQKIHNINTELKLSGSNTAGIDAAVKAVSGLTGAFTALQGAQALFASDDENLQKTLTNVASAMAILQGIQAAGEAIAEESPLNGYLKSLLRVKDTTEKASGATELLNQVNETASGITETLNSVNETATTVTETLSVATEGQAAAIEQQTIATGEATVAQRGLSAAMLANPATALVVSLIALYAAYELYARTVGQVSDAEAERTAVLNAVTEAEKSAADTIGKEQGQLALLLATAKDETATKQDKAKALHEIHQNYSEYLTDLNQENVYTAESAKLIEKQIDFIKRRAIAQASADLYQSKLAEQIKAQAELNRVVEEGGTFWETFWANFGDVGDAGGGIAASKRVSEQQRLITDKTDALKDATVAANGAFDAGVKAQTDFANATENNHQKLSEFIGVLDSFSQKMYTSFGNLPSPKNILPVPFVPAQPVPFDEKEFEDEKKRLQDITQFRIDIAAKGSQAEFNARRKQLDENFQQELKDRRLFDAQGNAISAETDAQANAQALAIQGKYLADRAALSDEARQRELKSQSDAGQASINLLKAKGLEGSDAYYEARKNALVREAAEEIYQARFSAEAQLRIYSQLAIDKNAIDKEQAISKLQAEQSVIKTKLNNIQPGTSAELNLKIQSIKIQEQLDEQAANVAVAITQAQVDKQMEIRSNAARQIFDLNKQYNLAEQQAYYNTQIANTQTRLLEVRKGSLQELELRKQLIDEQTRLEDIGYASQIKNAAELAAKIHANDTKALLDKKKLTDDFNRQLFDRQQDFIEHSKDAQIAADEEIINSSRATLKERYKAQVDAINAEIDVANEKILQTLFAQIDNKIDDGDAEKIIADLKKRILELEARLKGAGSEYESNLLDNVAKGATAAGTAMKQFSEYIADTNPKLAELFSNLSDVASIAGNVASALAKGDYISAAANVISGTLDFLKQVKDTAKKSKDDIINYQHSIIVGEISYNEMLRNRERTIKNINDLTIEQLHAQQQLLQTQREQAAADEKRLLALISQEKYISGTHSEKEKGGFIGGGLAGLLAGNKTKTVQDLSTIGNVDFDQLEKLFQQGKLTDSAKDLYNQLKAIHDEVGGIDDSAAELQQQLNEALTGTTADSITDDIIKGFQDGKRAAADFADDFQSLMQNAILQSLKYNALQQPLQDFYNQFAADVQSDNALTDSEITNLQNIYDGIINNASKQFEELQNITKVSFDPNSSSSSSPNSLQGAVKNITEESAQLLAGQFGAVRLNTASIQQIATQQLNQLVLITNYAADIPNMKAILADMMNRGIKIRA